MPVIVPDVVGVVATPVLPLLHVPPPVAVSVVTLSSHNRAVPVIAGACGLTVNTIVAVATPQLPDTVYVIFAVPVALPETTPVTKLMLAVPGASLIHVPPVTPFANVAVEPRQTVVGPVKGPATAVLVTVIVWMAVAFPHAPVTV
jgi:hypothetical protein